MRRWDFWPLDDLLASLPLLALACALAWALLLVSRWAIDHVTCRDCAQIAGAMVWRRVRTQWGAW